MRNNYVCYTKFPNINDLLCLFATINNFEKDVTSLFNLVILKCRQLIFENNNVIALPQSENSYGIYIIVKEDYYSSGELKKSLSILDLKTGAPTVVQRYIYEACCVYTITAKLAPKWNQVNNYFIKGRNFLIEPNMKDCLRLNLCINDKGNTSMIFEISRVRLPIMTLEQISLTENELNVLKTNKKIFFKYSYGHSIRVLPSLKRGNILSLSLSINESSAMKNYQQLRRHWKNTYGYRLPEEDRSIFYMEVSFFEGSQIFTYPSICVRTSEPTYLQRINPAPVVADFVIDLQTEMPTILGERYPIPSYVGNPDKGIIPSSQISLYPNPSQATITKEDKKISDTQTSAVIYLPTQKNPSQNRRKLSEDDSKSKLSQLLAQLNKVEERNVVHYTTNNCENKIEDNKNVQQLKENSLKNCPKTGNQFSPRFKFKKVGIQTPNNISTIKKIGLAIPSNDTLRKKQESVIVITDTLDQGTKENVNKKKIIENHINDDLSEFSPAKKMYLKDEAIIINNMKELVQNGGIHKLNNEILFKWLKRRSVHCTTKEKKSDLVQKVINIVNNNL